MQEHISSSSSLTACISLCMLRLRNMSERAPTLSFVCFISVALLSCGGGGGGGTNLAAGNDDGIAPAIGGGGTDPVAGNDDGIVPAIGGGTIIQIPETSIQIPEMSIHTPEMSIQIPETSLSVVRRTGNAENNVFTITTSEPNLMIDGRDGNDQVELSLGAVATSIVFSDTEPTGGRMHLWNIESIQIEGGEVKGDIDISGASAVIIDMNSGTIGGNVIGGGGNDIISLAGDITGRSPTLNLAGTVDGADGNDEVRLNMGASVSSVLLLSAGQSPQSGQLGLRNIEVFTLNGGMVSSSVGFNRSPTAVVIDLISGSVPSVLGSQHSDTVRIMGDMVTDTDSTMSGTQTELTVGLGISGLRSESDEIDEIIVLSGGVVPNINFTNDIDQSSDATTQAWIDFEHITIDGGTVMGNIDATGLTENGAAFNLLSGMITGDVTGSPNVDTFILAGIDFGEGITIVGGGGNLDEFRLNPGASVGGISFRNTQPISGNVHLQDVQFIRINGGTVNGQISGSSRGNGFILQSGRIRGNVVGGNGVDNFDIYSGIMIVGVIDGGGGFDQLRYSGATGTDFDARGGLADDPDIRDREGSVRNIGFQTNTASITSLSVLNIEALALSPALNLYGALSDALMQFGQQTAQGFALADMNPQTGRLTQLISKDSPFTKGRIWAHKITHSGNGKGSIGLSLTGLTARAPSDYDYEMSLTQHGFDAPVVSSQWGDFGLRAVSHTMTGTIETNTAEANVSGYGAGLAFLWQRGSERSERERHHNGLSANLTALAGGYEVDAHTSPSNPQAVVNEVSEGSFSAINAVISAGVADKRELANGLVMRTTADVSWQTLSLDDFTETGADGIIINFDKATRFTARIGTGLESEHWFSDIAFVHETSSGGTLSSGLSQDYRQHDGTAFEMKFGGKMADLATGLTIKAFAVWRQSVSGLAGEPSAQFELSYRF